MTIGVIIETGFLTSKGSPHDPEQPAAGSTRYRRSGCGVPKNPTADAPILHRRRPTGITAAASPASEPP